MNYSDWKTTLIDPLKIKLDKLNPRVILDNYNQENIRNYLIEHFEIVDLANSMIEHNGIPPTERILCIKEGDEIIVVEGNRRVTACQILKNPELLSSDLKHRVTNSTGLQSFLDQIEIIVAPNRDVTESYITMRHTGIGVKRWSRLAENRRYIIRYRDQKQSISHISKVLNISEYNVKRGIQFYYFIEYIKNSLDWSEEERKIINDPLLETSKIDRFLPFSTPAKEIMTISFDASHNLIYEIEKKNFDEALKSIVKKIFITKTINTRSTFDNVFTNEIKELCKVEKYPAKNKQKIKKTIPPKQLVLDSTGNQTTILEPDNVQSKENPEEKDHNPKPDIKERTKRQPKPSQRKNPFEGINYDGDVIGISQTLYELHKINVERFPFSTNVLIRTLLECTIQEYVEHNNININIKGNESIKDLSIDRLIYSCTNKDNGNYKLLSKHNKTVARIINEANGKRDADELNIVTHGVYREPSSLALWEIERRWYSAISIMISEVTGLIN